MRYRKAKTHGFGTRVAICFALAGILLLSLPAPTFAQQVTPLCADGQPATRGATGALNSCADGSTPTSAKAADPSPTTCEVSLTSWAPIFNWRCWGRTIGALVGALVVYVASWFLTLSGALFNWVLNFTVVQFGQFMTDSVKLAVTSAWTAFRDVANIIIIGMFTFIAISIILGLKEFGQKKLIAHVLIIAVLINFSLLFSKMVIDASNFVATQFYNAGLNQSAAGAANSTTQLGIGNCPDGAAQAGTASQCYGIAGAFMDYAGVSSLLDTRQATANLADSLDNGFLAFLHAIFVAILFTAAALVLFYGSFLLVSRAILFIFLMAVSSLAFASYLVPVLDKGNFGFNAWKDSILKNALLAPLMIMFLWMTLNIANAMKQGASGGTLGDLITHPDKSLDINALFSYVVILGLLFMSFKLSSSLAGKIGGFSFASMATVLPFTMANRFIAAPLLRQGVGWLGSKYQNSRIGQARDLRNLAGRARAGEEEAKQKGLTASEGRFRKMAETYEKRALRKDARAERGGLLASSKMNILDTAAAKAALGAAGVKGFAAGASTKDTKSYEGQLKARAEAAEKQAARLAPSADQNEKVKLQINEERKFRRDQLAAIRDNAKTTEDLGNKLEAAKQRAKAQEDASTQEKIRIATTPGLSDRDRKAQMNAEDQKIKNASAVVQGIQSRIDFHEKPVKDYDQETENIAKKVIAGIGKSGENIAEKIGQKSGDVFERALGHYTGANAEIGKKTKDIYKKKIKTSSLRDVIADIQAEGGAAPAAPATPPAPRP